MLAGNALDRKPGSEAMNNCGQQDGEGHSRPELILVNEFNMVTNIGEIVDRAYATYALERHNRLLAAPEAGASK